MFRTGDSLRSGKWVVLFGSTLALLGFTADVWPAAKTKKKESVSREAGMSSLKAGKLHARERLGNSPRKNAVDANKQHHEPVFVPYKNKMRSVPVDVEGDPFATAATRLVKMPLDKVVNGRSHSVHLNMVGKSFKLSFGLKNGKARMPVSPPKLPPMPNELAAYRHLKKTKKK